MLIIDDRFCVFGARALYGSFWVSFDFVFIAVVCCELLFMVFEWVGVGYTCHGGFEA